MNNTQARELAERVRAQLRAREVIRETDGFLMLERAIFDRACAQGMPIVELCVEEDDDASCTLNMYRGTRESSGSGPCLITTEQSPFEVSEANIDVVVAIASSHLRTTRGVRRRSISG